MANDKCVCCGKLLNSGDPYYDIRGDIYCVDCIKTRKRNCFKNAIFTPVFLSASDVINLITSADNTGCTHIESRGLPPIKVVFPNIQAVRTILEKEASTNDELNAIMQRVNHE